MPRAPIPAGNPPAKSRAAASEKRPSGSMTKCSIAWVDPPMLSPGTGVRSGPMPIYLDHAATTPLRREVLDAMLPFLTESFGNPSSAHAFGRDGAGGARRRPRAGRGATQRARPARSSSRPAAPRRTTSRSRARPGPARRRGHRIVTSSVEHHAVGHTLRYLEKFGFEVVELPVDRYGRVDPDQLEAALNDRTILVSIMLANNEVGTIQPIAEIAAPGADAQGHPAPRRRRPGGPVRRPRRRGPRRGPRVARGPQVRGAQGRRRAVRPPRDAHPRPAAGRHPGAPPAGRARRTSPVPSGWPPRTTSSCAERAGDRRRGCASSATRLADAVLAVARRRARRAIPSERLPGLLSIVARDTDGASVAMSLDLEGIACSVGFGVHDGLDRGQPRPDRDGLPGGGGARRAAPVARPDDDRRRDRRRRATSCRGSIASMRLGTAAVGGGSARAGRARVSRILVAMSGGVDSSVAAALLHEQGHEVVGVWMRLHDVADIVLRVQEELLLARCGRRRAAGRGPARHPVLRHEPRARVRRRRAPAVPRRLPRRRDAVARASTATRT